MSNLSKMLIKGGALARQGDIPGARTIFEKAVLNHSDSSESWVNLSAVYGMEGNHTEALRCARKAVELKPRSLQGWVNLGNAADSCGDLTQAAMAFQRANELPQCPPDVGLQLALTLVQLGNFDGAEKPLRAYLSRFPRHREAILALGKIFARKGDNEAAAAVTLEYCQTNPRDVRALSQLGAIYLDLGRISDAWRICDQAMAYSAGAGDALLFRATLLSFEGRYSEARNVYEQLLQLKPDDPHVLMMLSLACYQSGRASIGNAYARAALNAKPANVTTLASLGNIFMMIDPSEARRLMEKAVAIDPNDPRTLVLRAQILEFEGDRQGAWECAISAIERGSVSIEAAVVVASAAPAIGKTREAVELLDRLVTHPGLSLSNQRALHFALANLCDKAKEYDRAFSHAIIANRLKGALHDSRAHDVEVQRLKFVYAASPSFELPRSSVLSELPIFIVGMPRSGTSLLEQILSCHSKVHPRGETTDVEKLVEQIPYYPDGVRDVKEEKLDAIANSFIQNLVREAPSATRVTDKLPGNYMFLGIISQLFPGARVLNCKRDPRDICLSNYFIDFGAGLNFSYDLESLAQTYRSYLELMEHWKAVLPIPIMDVQYEELIEQPRAWVESILRFCGLDWEDACLNFHESKRLAVTASYDQVRRPLYKSSVARWKNYARQLEPVNRILGLSDDS